MPKRVFEFTSILNKKGTWYFGFLVVILVVSFTVRLYGINRIVADWHSFRQVDTASVTREYVKHGIDPLRPRYHDVSNIASGSFNPEGWRMVEFPLLNVVVAGVLKLQPSWPLVQTHRLVSIFSCLVTLLSIAWLMRQWYGRLTALIAAAIFGLMPFSIYFSRVILPEPFMVMWAVLGVVAWQVWARRTAVAYDTAKSDLIALRDVWLLAGAASFGTALLVKPVAIFFLPLYLVVLWRWRRPSTWAVGKAVLLLALSILPLLWWRNWIQQYPEGIPASDWLLNGNGIRFRPAWWRWLFADRLGRMMFGNWGAVLLILGAVASMWQFPGTRRSRQTWFTWGCKEIDTLLQREGLVLGSIFLIFGFFVVFATGNVQHDYYQTLILPAVAMVSARGVLWLLQQGRTWWQFTWISLGVLMTMIFSFGFAWYDIEALFSIRNPAIEPAGQAVQRLTPPDSLVIAHYMGDTTLLFATDRRGWSIGYNLEEKRAQGAEFYVATANDDATREVTDKYPVIEENNLYIIADLRTPLSTSSGVRK